MYWLSIISSILGIASFAISFFEYFKKWKPYLLNIAFAMVGLTLGIVLSMSEKTVQQFTQSQLIYLVALVSLITLVILFVHRFLNNSHDPFFVVMIVLGAMGYFVLKVLNSVESSQSFVKPNDYLILSDHYITSGNYARAADYLKKYKEIESYDLSKAISDSLDKHIDALYLRGIQQLK